jgi:hypothetical protein
MAAKKQKNILLSDDGWFLLGLMKAGTNDSDTQIITECLAMGAYIRTIRKSESKKILYRSIVGTLDSVALHRAAILATDAFKKIANRKQNVNA